MQAPYKDKYNVTYDFDDKSYDVPLPEDVFTYYDLDYNEYVKVFVTIALAQMFNKNDVVFRYLENTLYFDVFIKSRKQAIIFVDRDNYYNQEDLDAVRRICEVFKYKLLIIYLFDNIKSLNPRKHGDCLYIDIDKKDKLDILDTKTKNMLRTIIKVCMPWLQNIEAELYKALDTQICYKMAVLMSLKERATRHFGRELENFLKVV